MMEDVIYNAIKADATVAGLLPAYANDKPIFTGDIPDKAPFPCIMITGLGGPNWGTRDKKGGVVAIDVQCFDNKKKSDKAVRDLAEKVWLLLDRHELTPWITNKGYSNVGCIADTPRKTQDRFGFDGYTIRLALRFIQL